MRTIDIGSIIAKIVSDSVAPSVERNVPADLQDRFAELVKVCGEAVCPGFVLDDQNTAATHAACRWAQGLPFKASTGEGDPTKGIFIAGPTGCGKTVLTKVVRKFADACDARVRTFGHIYDLCTWFDVRADEIVQEAARTGDVSGFVDAPILCIQDLGSEPKEALYMGNRIEPLRQIIERRGDREGGLLIITSNLNPEDLATRYGERVQSRIRSLCNYIFMPGRDRRIPFNSHTL